MLGCSPTMPMLSVLLPLEAMIWGGGSEYPVSVPILIEYISFSSQFFWIETAKSIVIGMDEPVRIQTRQICLNCTVLHTLDLRKSLNY